MTKQTHRNVSSRPALFPPAAWFNAEGVEALKDAGEACGKACQSWQEEVIRFMSARLECDAELGSRLMACGNWSEAVKLQLDWTAKAGRDYLNEASRLAQLASTLGAQMMQPSIRMTRPTTPETPVRHVRVAQ